MTTNKETKEFGGRFIRQEYLRLHKHLPPAAHGRTAAVVAGLGGAAVLATTLSGALASSASSAVHANCQAVPHACGYPDATNTGPKRGTVLKTVPGKLKKGAGWWYDGYHKVVQVTGYGAVLSGLSFTVGVNITASHVTMKNDRVVTGQNWGISLVHTAGDTIENTTVSGLNAGHGRLFSAISDHGGQSTGILIKNNNISDFRSAIQVTAGLVMGNYIHHPGYIAGDHTNGVLGNGGTGRLTISHNTILIGLGQTDAITLDTRQIRGPVTNKTIVGNLLAGGCYAIYGGSAFGHTTARIRIQNNRFGQGFYRTGGQYGPVLFYNPFSAGNVWAGNVWDFTGAAVRAPLTIAPTGG